MVFQKVIDSWLFVAPSHTPFKKYDVYNNRTGHYITSFGALKKNGEPYEQYNDNRIGYYKQDNHYDFKQFLNHLLVFIVVYGYNVNTN